MRKVFFMAVLAAVTLSATAAKKKNAEVATPASATVNIKSGSDSLSYAAGYAQTNGLIPYLQDQLKVDTAYMADFIQGLKDAKEKSGDPRFAAYVAGNQIAQLIEGRMIAGLSNELKDSPDALNSELFYAGFLAALANDTTKFTMAKAEKFTTERIQADIEYKNKKLEQQGKDWLAENAKKAGVVTTASGLQYKVITMGNGARPTADQEVTVKYEGKLIDGTVFDSSYKRNPQTSKFKCNQVIKGWTEGLQLMPVGSKFEFYIPYNLAYGERGQGRMIPPYATLIFTVELVDITAEAPKASSEPKTNSTVLKKSAIGSKK